jgi:hypothetical protein
VRPVTNADQERESFLLRVLPAVRLRHYSELHGNHADVPPVQGRYRGTAELRLDVTVEVERATE